MVELKAMSASRGLLYSLPDNPSEPPYGRVSIKLEDCTIIPITSPLLSTTSLTGAMGMLVSSLNVFVRSNVRL